MTAEDLHRLIEEYRDGTIAEADARRLADAIRADEAVADAVRRELAFSGHLGQAVDDSSFERSFAERLRAERGGADFVRAFEKRTSVRRTRRIESPRPSLVPFFVAAALALAIVGILMMNADRAPEKALVKVAPAPAPAPEEVPVAPRPLPPTPPPPARVPEEPPPSPPPVLVPPAPEKPAPPPERTPEKPVEPPKPPSVKPTEVAPSTAVAKIDRVEGEVYVAVDGDRQVASRGQEISPGMSVITGMASSRATIALADGTRIGLGADATIREIAKGPKGTRVTLTAGTLSSDVAKQPVDQPLVFATPHGEARVLGTVLRLVVDPAWTRLEVKEGKVRLTRDGKSVDVGAGQYATAGQGMPLSARSLSPDEIVLYPQQARLTGAEWSLQRDVKSLSGVVLEAGASPFKVIDHVETRPSYATYTFYATADKEYRIWIRAASQEKGDPWTRDMVTIEPTRAVLSQKSPFFGTAPTTAWVVTGVAATPGFTWISGHGEEGKTEPALTVRFHESGFQNLRLYVGHPWVRVDAIWLSATQKTRPAAKQLPPPSEK